jgi:nicotinate-nucleotide adenylyltransferase
MGVRLALFGGTFNPIHLGHLRLAEDVREQFELARVIFIPTNIPPHKSIEGDVPSSHRLAMLSLALESNNGFSCDDVELRRGGHSYTVDTVEYVYQNYQFEGRPFFILGSDLIPELHTWKAVDRLVQLVHFIVLVRTDYPFSAPPRGDILDMQYSVYDGRKMDVRSSEIRRMIGKGKSVRYLVTDRVYQYIHDHGLYKHDDG